MNIWLKTSTSRKSLLKKSLAASSISSYEPPLPTIAETDRVDEEKLNDSEDSSEENSDEREEVSSTTFFQKSKDKKMVNIFNSSLIKSKQIYHKERENRRESLGAKNHFEKLFNSDLFLQREISSSSNDQKVRRGSISSSNGLTHSINERIATNQRVRTSRQQTASKRILTTGRKNDVRQHIISIIEYCSNEVGLAIYNMKTGQIKLTQIIERMTYFRTISTIERFYPYEIIYSSTLESTPLVKKLIKQFKKSNFRPLKRNLFDETKGYSIYSKRGNQDEHNPDHKFLSYAALNALITYLENSFQANLTFSALNIKWHLLDQLLVIDSETISDLQIFLNLETKESSTSFVDNFRCLTDGGSRMLRANLFQPLSDGKQINERLKFLEFLLQKKVYYEFLWKELSKFRHYEPITAKFIQSAKKSNLKSIKSYLGTIYSLSRLCFELQNLRKKIDIFVDDQKYFLRNLQEKLKDKRLKELRDLIKENFDEKILNNFEKEKGHSKKENFIFLFRVEKINDEFAAISRMTYTQTIQNIKQMFNKIKQKSKIPIKLLYTQHRGYYLSAKSDIDLVRLSEAIQDDIVYICQRDKMVTFSTSIIASMNNRLKQNENKLMFQSEEMLLFIITEIQKNLQILFEISYWLSVIDMVVSFASFIKSYKTNHGIEFTAPEFVDKETMKIQNLRTIWTMQKFNKKSFSFSLQTDQPTSALVFLKQMNSFNQVNLLLSVGYIVILAQIGCFVPAASFQTQIFNTLISKFKTKDSLENNLSNFQVQCYSMKNILENSKTNKSRCLILIDELIKGTQYKEECALSMACMQQLTEVNGKIICLVGDRFLFELLNRLKKVSLCEFSEDEENLKNQQEEVEEYLRDNGFDEEFMKYFNEDRN